MYVHHLRSCNIIKYVYICIYIYYIYLFTYLFIYLFIYIYIHIFIDAYIHYIYILKYIYILVQVELDKFSLATSLNRFLFPATFHGKHFWQFVRLFYTTHLHDAVFDQKRMDGTRRRCVVSRFLENGGFQKKILAFPPQEFCEQIVVVVFFFKGEPWPC